MTYEEMIEDETFVEGMQTRIMSDQEMDTMYIPDVEYMNIDGISRVLQILVPRKRVMENEKYPLIVYVQGSAWHKQNVYQHEGESIVMPAGLPHAVYGKEQFKMLLVVVF